MISGILLFFIETKIGRAIAITTGAIAIVVASWLTFKVHYINVGEARMAHKIAVQDAAAVKAGQDAYKQVKDCMDAGGTWNIDGGGVFDSGGVCDKQSAGKS